MCGADIQGWAPRDHGSIDRMLEQTQSAIDIQGCGNGDSAHAGSLGRENREQTAALQKASVLRSRIRSEVVLKGCRGVVLVCLRASAELRFFVIKWLTRA